MDIICILSFKTNLPAIKYFIVRRTGSLPIINGILTRFLSNSICFQSVCLLQYLPDYFNSRNYRSIINFLFSLTGLKISKVELIRTYMYAHTSGFSSPLYHFFLTPSLYLFVCRVTVYVYL